MSGARGALRHPERESEDAPPCDPIVAELRFIGNRLDRICALLERHGEREDERDVEL